MSKKKFTEGLEILFEEANEEMLQEEELTILQSEEKKPAKKATKRSSGKEFSSDMQSFLNKSFQESLEKRLNKENTNPNTPTKKKTRKPLSGLDFLIRNTLNEDEASIQPAELPTKRVTFVMDRQKLDKLKKIAKEERTYLREIVDQMVDIYLQEYFKNQDDHK